jgi:phosphatidylglycerol lysyltransferase
MDYLFAKLMLWGKDEGFDFFSLGMAPLAGIESGDGAPIWNKVASLAFRHGEHFYNFEGLRKYKNKFDPVWEPRFIASPGGFALPIVLADIATTISGGLPALLTK